MRIEEKRSASSAGICQLQKGSRDVLIIDYGNQHGGNEVRIERCPRYGFIKITDIVKRDC